MRGCAIIMTSITELRPAIAPSSTSIVITCSIALPPEATSAARTATTQRRRRAEHLLVRHEADRDARDEDVEDRADDERAEDADRHVALRVLRLLRRDVDTASKPMYAKKMTPAPRRMPLQP